MSSKFNNSGPNFRTPPVCRKVKKPPAQAALPSPQMSAWYSASGEDDMGNTVKIDTTITMQLIVAEPIIYLGGLVMNGRSWTFELLQVDPDGITWGFRSVSDFHGAIFGTAQINFFPRRLKPYDSGILQLVPDTGSGSASTRILL